MERIEGILSMVKVAVLVGPGRFLLNFRFECEGANLEVLLFCPVALIVTSDSCV